MEIFFLLLLIVFLILVGIGVAVGLVLCLIALVAAGMGVVSSSVAFGIIQGRPSSGFRAFFYQVCVLAFAAAGVVIAWLVSTFGELSLSGLAILGIGALTGVAAGLLFGLLHSWMIDVAGYWLNKVFAKPEKTALPVKAA